MSAWDLAIASRTVWAEARNQGPAGMTAVAWAIVNRRIAGKWYSDASLAGCCLHPWAFSSWNEGDPNGPQALRVAETDPLLVYCAGAIQAALTGGEDPVGGATHYYAEGTTEPSWVTGKSTSGIQVAPPAVFCVQIGKHIFFKNVQ